MNKLKCPTCNKTLILGMVTVHGWEHIYCSEKCQERHTDEQKAIDNSRDDWDFNEIEQTGNVDNLPQNWDEKTQSFK